MAEDKSGDRSKKTEPARDDVTAAPEANPIATKESGGGTPDQGRTSSQEGSLMPAAVYNLLIAQQYIDGTKFPDEHKLVCFNYAISLLAVYRNDRAKRVLASRFLAAAAGWAAGDPEDAARSEAIDRIVCESHYNLGVIEELNRDFPKALESYARAALIAEKYKGNFDNVAILAQLGTISSEIEAIRQDEAARNRTEPKAKQVQGSDMTLELQRTSAHTQNRIFDLRNQITRLQQKAAKRPSKAGSPPSTPSLRDKGFLRFFRRSEPPQSNNKGTSSEVHHAVQRKPRILEEIADRLKRFQDELDRLTPPRPRETP